MAGNKFYQQRRWRRLRSVVVLKYHGACTECGCDGATEVHHVKPIDKYPELSFDIDNLVLLCRSCHNKVHDRMNGELRESETVSYNGLADGWQ